MAVRSEKNAVQIPLLMENTARRSKILVVPLDISETRRVRMIKYVRNVAISTSTPAATEQYDDAMAVKKLSLIVLSETT